MVRLNVFKGLLYLFYKKSGLKAALKHLLISMLTRHRLAFGINKYAEGRGAWRFP